MYSHTTEIWDRIEDLLDDVFVFDGKPLQILMQISEADGLLVQNPTPLDKKKLPWDSSSWANLHPQVYSLEHISYKGERIWVWSAYLPSRELTTEKDKHLFQTILGGGDATYQTNS